MDRGHECSWTEDIRGETSIRLEGDRSAGEGAGEMMNEGEMKMKE